MTDREKEVEDSQRGHPSGMGGRRMSEKRKRPLFWIGRGGKVTGLVEGKSGVSNQRSYLGFKNVKGEGSSHSKKKYLTKKRP